MKTQKTNCILAATVLMTSLLGATSVCRADTSSAQMPRTTATKSVEAQRLRMEPVVSVNIGDALLEEYRGGNPADRTVIIRGVASAQVPKAAERSKSHA